MVKPRTHFEQVPLEIIKKIVGDQISPEIFMKQDPATSNLKRKKSSSRAKARLKANSRAYLQMKGRKQ